MDGTRYFVTTYIYYSVYNLPLRTLEQFRKYFTLFISLLYSCIIQKTSHFFIIIIKIIMMYTTFSKISTTTDEDDEFFFLSLMYMYWKKSQKTRHSRYRKEFYKSLSAYQRRMRKKTIPRASLQDPSEAAMIWLLRSNSDQAYITKTGLDVRTFRELH